MKDLKLRVLMACLAGFMLLGIDFLIKALANRGLTLQSPRPTFLPFLELYLTHNRGYHFLFGEISNHRIWAISGIILVTLLVVLLIRSLYRERASRGETHLYLVMIALMIGAAGNVLEVFFMGHATDYFIFHPFPWPSNIADQYINSIIYIILPVAIIVGWLERRRQRLSAPPTDNPTDKASEAK